MHVRVTTFEGPLDGIEEGIRIYREEVIPWLRDSTGFRGWMVLLDRSQERALGLTFWSSEATMNDNAASGASLRDELAASVGTVMKSLEHYEVAAVESLSLDGPDRPAG